MLSFILYSNRLGPFPFLRSIINISFFPIFITLKGILFERGALELYLVRNKQKQLLDRHMLYVDFLCKELKLPLQIIAYVIESIDSKFLDQQGILSMRRMILNVQEMVLYKFKFIISLLNIKIYELNFFKKRILIDNLLLSIRIEEGRLQVINIFCILINLHNI
jgi:hypothetical protein